MPANKTICYKIHDTMDMISHSSQNKYSKKKERETIIPLLHGEERGKNIDFFLYELVHAFKWIHSQFCYRNSTVASDIRLWTSIQIKGLLDHI